jgi:hypothetical protein
MVNRVAGKSIALLLAIMLPASSVMAESRGAMLFVSNSALVNGAPVSRASAVFSGDKLSVPANSSVTINAPGSSILVPALSNVTYNGDSIALDPQAAVAVTTTRGMVAQIGSIKISPARNASAKFQVARYNGQVFVAAKQGTVLIASSIGNRFLEAGKTTSLPDPNPQAPVPAAKGASVQGSDMPTWVAVLIGVAAAGAAAGAVIATTGAPSTPAHP